MAVVKKMVKIFKKDIQEYSKNEKIHTNENLALIRKSISDIGYVTPIVIDENNVILAGHGRFAVMLESKTLKIECMQITGLTELQKKKFRLYDNQTARTGHFDNDLLLDTVGGILAEDSEFNIGILGIEGLAEAFSDEIISLDLGTAKFEKVENESPLKVLVVVTDRVEEIKELLRKEKGTEFSQGIKA